MLAIHATAVSILQAKARALAVDIRLQEQIAENATRTLEIQKAELESLYQSINFMSNYNGEPVK